MNNFLKFLIISNIWIASVFGLQLHFFSTSGLDDPEIDTIYALVKDFYAAISVVVIFLCAHKRGWILRQNYYFYLICLLFLISVFIRFEKLTIDDMKLVKNVFLYGLLFPIVISMAAKDGLMAEELYSSICKSIYMAMIISAVMYILFPFASYTQRNFGTFGNPNALGIFSVVAFVMAQKISHIPSRFFITVVSIGNLVTSMSNMAYLLFIISLLAVMSVEILMLLGLILLPTVLVVSNYDFSLAFLFERVFEMADSRSSHVSVSTRYEDYLRAIENLFSFYNTDFILLDAALSVLMYNFGFFGLLIFLVWSWFGALRPFFLNRRVALNNPLYLVTVLMCLSAVTQYTVITYPGVFYFSLFILLINLTPSTSPSMPGVR